MKKVQEILLIDDFRQENNIHKAILSKYFNVEKFTCMLSVDEAMKYLISLQEQKQGFPEYIFIDINLPMHNGWEFISWYRFLDAKYKLNTKLIVLSGSELIKMKPNKVDLSTIHHIVEKPLTADKLEEL